MTKLCEVLATKTGQWFQIGDIINVPLLVTEDMGADSEIRQTEDKKYYCLQVSDGKETKDLHMAKGALRAIAEALANVRTWKGQRFQITAVTGKGYSTKTHVSVLHGYDDPTTQTRLAVAVDMTKPAAYIPHDRNMSIVDTAVDVIRKYQAGVHESRILQLLKEELRQTDDAYVTFIFGSMKAGGRIKLDEQSRLWSVTS